MRRRASSTQFVADWAVLLSVAAALCFLMSVVGVAQEIGPPIVRPAVAAKGSQTTLNAMAAAASPRPWREGDPVTVRDDLEREGQFTPAGPPRPETMDVLLATPTVIAPLGPQPTIAKSFDGIPATGFVPPDISGAVGPKHYIQMVNAVLAIYDKAGNKLLGPVNINSVWKGFGGPCESQNAGDPITRYDRQADRWLISQFAVQSDFQCIAISKGPDPVNSGWFLYAFPTVSGGVKVTPDYPKVGIWPDGYYMGTQRGFPGGGLDVWVFERSKMLAGSPAKQVQFHVGAPSLFLLPADLDGPSPPAGAPSPFIRHVDGAQFGGQDRLELFEFAVNWGQPASSTFQKIATLPTAPFSAVLCGSNFNGDCVQQPGTTQKLETLPAWMMWRLQYRNFGTHQTLVTNHTVNANGKDQAGVRWYELRKLPGKPWVIQQQGTHAPDAANRWMGSIAMDVGGNMVLAYSVASSSIFPGLRAAWRRAGDPANVLAQGEFTLIAGAGSQTGFDRWGDYSTMDVDPANLCTFWYTGEYYATTSTAGWRTRIVQIKLPNCKIIPVPIPRPK